MKLLVPPGLVVKKSRHMRASIVAALPMSLLLGSLGSAMAADDPLFVPPFLSFDTGSHPWSVAIGDLNGDGKPDLLVACYGNGLSVLLGHGDGTFESRVDYPVIGVHDKIVRPVGLCRPG